MSPLAVRFLTCDVPVPPPTPLSHTTAIIRVVDLKHGRTAERRGAGCRVAIALTCTCSQFRLEREQLLGVKMEIFKQRSALIHVHAFSIVFLTIKRSDVKYRVEQHRMRVSFPFVSAGSVAEYVNRCLLYGSSPVHDYRLERVSRYTPSRLRERFRCLCEIVLMDANPSRRSGH